MNVAVVGGGVAGLTAALVAVDSGASVTVFDARKSLGGRARTHSRGGFQLNEGAHALYQGGPAMAFLKQLGIEPAGGVPNVGNGVGVDGELVGQFPSGPVSLMRTPLLKGDRPAVLKLFATLPKLDPSEFKDMTVRQAMTKLLGPGTAGRFGEALIRLSSYGNDPEHASADAGLAQLKLAMDSGVRYLDGGWQVIVDGLLRKARARQVMVRTETKITGVRPVEPADGTRTVELMVDGVSQTFDAVVLATGGPGPVASLLGDAVPAAKHQADRARPATVASLDVGLAGPWGPHPTFALGIDQPLYLSVHAPVAKLAPEGQTLVHVMRYHHPDETPDTAGQPGGHRAACEALLDRVRPGWRDDAIHVGFSPRLIAAHDQASAAQGGLSGRPSVEVTDAPGVFLAGDWVGDTGTLVDASVASGQQAGRLAASGPRVSTIGGGAEFDAFKSEAST